MCSMMCDNTNVKNKLNEYSETIDEIKCLNSKLANLKQEIILLSSSYWELQVDRTITRKDMVLEIISLQMFNNVLKIVDYKYKFEMFYCYMKRENILNVIEQLKNDKPILDTNSTIYVDCDDYSDRMIVVEQINYLNEPIYMLYDTGHDWKNKNKYYISKENLIAILENILQMST